MAGAGRLRIAVLALVAAGVALGAGAPGDLDTSFGTGGVASVDVPFSAGAYSTDYRDGVRQSGGRIVLVGSQTGSQHAWYATALERAGNPDTTFGSSGVATLFPDAVNGQLSDAVLDGQDRIIVCGTLSFQVVQRKKTTTVGGLAVARLTASGALDTAFGNGGLVLDALSDFTSIASPRAQWVAIQADGKIVVAGEVVKVKGTNYTNTACLLVRYLASGQRDTTFGTGGVVIDDLSPAADGASTGLAFDGSGRLLVGGYSPTYGYALSRYKASGAVDSSFGSGGRVFPAFALRSIAVDAQDRALACGGELGQGDIARYTTSGTLDSTFGSGGLLAEAGIDYFFEVAVESDGNLLVTGLTDAGVRSISRVLPDGTLDTGFGTSGRAEGPVTNTMGNRIPVLLGSTTVAFPQGGSLGNYGSPWYVTQFCR